MLWRWLLFAVIAALVGTSALLGARLGQVKAERDALRVQERASETQIAQLSAEILGLKTQIGDLTSQGEADRKALQELRGRIGFANTEWHEYAAPQRLARADFEPLGRADGVIVHEGGPTFTRTGEQVERAVKYLAGALPLGPVPAPVETQVLVRVEFVGIPDGTVLLTTNIVHFRGQGYFIPEIGLWFPTIMNAN